MAREKLESIGIWVLSVLLTLAFLAAGIPKLIGAAVWIGKFTNWGYPNWFAYVVGVLEVLGGILLVVPGLAIYGASLLELIMLGAGYTHLSNGEGLQVLRPLIVALLLGTLIWLRRPGRDRRANK